MSEKDRELMERYIYQVVRRLPKGQREDVGLELTALIEDMLGAEAESSKSVEEEIGINGSDDMERVLTKLGNPARFAEKYQDSAHHLIGPEYYDTWRWIVKVVLICTIIVVVLAGIIEGVQAALETVWTEQERNGGYVSDFGLKVGIGITAASLINIVRNGVVASLSVFGIVTLVFAVLERQKIKLDILEEKQWNLNNLGDNFTGKRKGWSSEKLSPIPHKKAVLKRSDYVVEIVFSVIVGVLLLFAPQIFSLITRENGSTVMVSVFNLKEWHLISPWILLSILFAVVDSSICLAVGHYCKKVLISKLVFGGILQLITTVMAFKITSFWNPDFIERTRQLLGDAFVESKGFLTNWNGETVTNVVLLILIAITLVEMAAAVYKYLRYGVKDSPEK